MKKLFFLSSIFLILNSQFSIASTVQLPQTGQTTCYDTAGTAITCSGSGQDGELKTGLAWPNPRFTDNGDQTVTDKLTGLIWTKDANLMKTRDPSFDADYTAGDGMVTWQHALDYIKKLNAENYQGHNDWRLPNSNELKSLVNQGQSSPYAWLNGQGFSNVQSNYYWSGSTYAYSTYLAWGVGMSGGIVFYSNKSNGNYVWPVRSGQSGAFGSLTLSKTGQTTCYDTSGTAISCSGTGQDGELQVGAAWPSPRFTANADQTVTDNLTGLIWSKDGNPAAATKTWQQALDYIKTLNSSRYQGYNDWRLPNRNELESLANRGQANSANWLNGQGFSTVQSYSYWSGSTYASNTNNAWYVVMYDGSVNGFIKSNYSYVWPVRSGQLDPLTLSLTTSGNGTISPDSGSITWSGSSGSASYSSGTTVNLTAIPTSGSTFSGWSGACSGKGTCSVTMDAARSVTATFVLVTTNATASSLPQTGQTTCYDSAGTAITCSGSGQDGELKTGLAWPNPRFTDNGDQTVTDRLTGLIWTKDANLMKTRDPSFDVDYASINSWESASDGRVTWQHALDYIKQLNSQNYQGHNDWRLPNANELASLVNQGQTNNATWLNGQGFSNVQADVYWSSTTYAYYTNIAWIVYMYDGNTSYYNKAINYYVWPVRGGQLGTLTLPKTGQTTCYDASGATISCSGTGQDGELQSGAAWPSSRFAANSDQTVTDNLTGLVWSKDGNPAGGTKTWQGALDYIKSLNSSTYLGHNDWRLPNVNELESLVNRGQADTATWLNGQGFSNVQASFYWSSSTGAYNSSLAWFVSMGNGYVDYDGKADSLYVWPVRGGQSGSSGSLTLSLTTSGNGTITPDSGSITWSGSSGSASYSSGITVTLVAIPTSGSTFSGWSGACSGTGTCSVTMDAARSVTATFVTAATPVNGVCGSSNGQTQSTVPTINLCTSGSATSITGSGPWYWSCSGSNGGTTASCSANIQTFTIPVTVTAGNGTISCSSPVAYNGSSTCTVTPGAGYSLNTLTDNGVNIKTSVSANSFTITKVTATHNIAATFTTALVNGACGSSNAGTFTSVPAINLCTSGNATTITGSGPWYWTCSGSSGGTSASCSASKQTFTIPVIVTSGNGTVSCTNPVPYGGSSTCIITPTGGYQLAAFLDNGIDKKTAISGSSYSIGNITANHTITATFEMKPDTTPPTVTIIDPINNSLQTDVLQINATASDNVAVTAVDLSVMVTLSGASWYLNSGNTFTKTATPIWVSCQYESSSGTWFKDTQPQPWSDNKTYTITARARDAAGNVSTTALASFKKVIQYPEVPSALTLDLSSNSIASNGTVTISGILSDICSSGSCTPINRQNRPVQLTIRNNDDNSIIHQQEYQTKDATGHYSSGSLSLFSRSGSYTVQATYSGADDLQSSTSATRILLVGKPAGYAVIIQGKVASGEGLAEHSKSTRRIYQTLKERNFTDDNIYWFNYGTVTDPQTKQQLAVDDTTPTINEIGNIISGTAAFSGDGQNLAQRMSTNPAPLYLIMVDHGSPDQFHLGDGDITPTILDGWLNTLDTNITTTAARTEKKVIIIGACYSGSFIKKPLSKTGRIIITSASKGEVSYRGGFDGQDNIQSGEYFLDELFASFKRLSDIKVAFTEASEKTWQYIPKGDSSNSNVPFANAVQHPLLDDNGDGLGSIILSDGSGDGAASKGVYLGVSPGSVNSLADPADLSMVTPTLYLDSTQTSGILWATATNPGQVSSVFVELLRPTDHIATTTGSNVTGQISRPIDQAQSMTPATNRFENRSFTFGTNNNGYGTYKAYYYAIDKETGYASPSKRSLIYRDKPGNNKPAAPTAVEPDLNGMVQNPANPAERAIPETTLQFQWNEATDPDGDHLTYSLEICTDISFTTGCKTYDEIASTTLIVEGLATGSKHYWRVWAVDPYTRSATSSEPRSFTPHSANPLLTIIRGQVIAADNPSQVISNAQVTLKTAGYPDRIAVTKTDGTFAYLGVPLNSATFDFSLAANRSDYTPSTIAVSIIPTGTSIYQLIPLAAGTAPVTTTTKAKIFLGNDDTFTVSSNGSTLYGSSGTDTVTITGGTTGIILDQNIERVNLPGAAGSYRFKQTGNKINIYDTSGTTLLVTAPVQGDSDGTILSFSDGSAAAQLTGGVMTLGGATVSATATALSPKLTATTPTTATGTTAKVFLGTDDIFTINSSGTTLYGGSGNDTVTIAAGVTGVKLDQNVERLNLPGAADSYTFKQTGNKINIYDAGGITLLVTIPVQGDADGTILGFSDGSTASALLAGGVMTVGGKTVPQ